MFQMAEELDDGEFWLPPKFLSDDDLLMEFGNEKSGGFGLTRPNSDLSSPGESVMGSTETESDEDEYLFGLSRRLAKTSLNDDLWKVEPNKVGVLGFFEILVPSLFIQILVFCCDF